MKKTGLITTMLAVLLAAAGCSTASKGADAFGLNIPGRNAVIEAAVARTHNNTTENTTALIYKNNGSYRIYYNDNKSGIDMLVKDGRLYLLGGDNKSALSMAATGEQADIFLSKVFVNIAIGKKQPRYLGEDKVGNKVCKQWNYSCMKNPDGIYCITSVTEWLANDGNMLMKAEAVTFPCEMGNGKRKLRFNEVRETFTVNKISFPWLADKVRFELPKDIVINKIDK